MSITSPGGALRASASNSRPNSTGLVSRSATAATNLSAHTYSYIRNLNGIVGVATKGILLDDPGDYPPPGLLGVYAERYLKAHGYRPVVWWHVIQAFKESCSSTDFVGYLTTRGFAETEAEYLYELITWSGEDPSN